MSVSINVPDELYLRASEVAASENIPVDDLFAVALREIPARHVEGSWR